MKISRFFLPVVFVSFGLMIELSGCTKEKVQLAPIKEVPAVSQSFCDSVGSTYAAMAKPILQANCATGSSCHVAGGSAPGDYTQYADVKTDVDNGSLASRTFDFKEMPPGAPLDSVTINKLKCWMAAGAKNN